jgi:phosphatidylinositol alpha-mannosyltransferase
MARIALSPKLFLKVRNVLENENFDLLHIHEPLMPGLPLTVLRLAKCPTIGTFHAFANKKRVYRYSKFLFARWTARLDGRIAVSLPAKQHASSYFPGQYEIIPNGIDVEHFSKTANPLSNYQDGKLNILFVGRMEKRKGLRYLLRAYSRLKWSFPNCRLIVVGPGELDEESARLIAERGLEDVCFEGMVSYDQLPAYFQTADIFCSPATGEESFGIVLLEAMASGTPIVASNIPGYASVVDDGIQGHLINPKNEEAFTNILHELLLDQKKRHELGKNGQKKARNFDWDIVANRILDFYNTIVPKIEKTIQQPL